MAINRPKPYAVQEEWSTARQDGRRPYRWLDATGRWTADPSEAATFRSWEEAEQHAEQFTWLGHYELVVPQSAEEAAELGLAD